MSIHQPNCHWWNQITTKQHQPSALAKAPEDIYRSMKIMWQAAASKGQLHLCALSSVKQLDFMYQGNKVLRMSFLLPQKIFNTVQKELLSAPTLHPSELCIFEFKVTLLVRRKF